MKNYHRLSKFINPEIKEGDIVFVWSDTAIVPVKPFNKHILVGNSYPVLTGIDAPINEIPALVIETGIASVVGICGLDVHILLDVKIAIGMSEFYVCSAFLLPMSEMEKRIKAEMNEAAQKIDAELDAELDAIADEITDQILSGNPEGLMLLALLEGLADAHPIVKR